MKNNSEPVVLPRSLAEMDEEEIERYFPRLRSEKPELKGAVTTPEGLMVSLSDGAIDELETVVGQAETDDDTASEG